jgi:hypothetical protein
LVVVEPVVEGLLLETLTLVQVLVLVVTGHLSQHLAVTHLPKALLLIQVAM